MVTEKRSVKTPKHCPPEVMVEALVDLVEGLAPHDRIAIGFPGVVRDGRVLTAPHWNRRLARVIPILYALLRYDRLFIGGGNSAKVSLDLSERVTLVSNDAGIKGGAMLWATPAGAGMATITVETE